MNSGYSRFFPDALTLAHRSLAALLSLAFAAALILRFRLAVALVAGAGAFVSPNNPFNSFCKDSIRSLILAACRSCLGVNWSKGILFMGEE